MNADAASQSLAVARRKLDAGEFSSAVRFAKKSLALHETDEAKQVLQQAERGAKGGGSAATTAAGGDATGSTSTSTATSAGPSTGSTRQRTTGAGAASSSSASSSRPPASSSADKGGGDKNWTPQQAAIVSRVKKCKVTAYYEILELKQECGEGEVKKAYRKLALGLHPDKNLAPGAEEAFKMVSKAFTVLSDPQKRAVYDQTGGDPDSRGGGGGGGGGGGFSPSSFGGGGGTRFPGFAGQHGNYGGRGEEISPEDLFRAFFGGGMGGGAFGNGFGGGGYDPLGGMGMGGGGGGSTFFFGPGMGVNGVRMGGGGRRPQQGGGGQAGAAGGQRSQSSAWVQMAPLLLLFAFSFLTQLPSLFGGGGNRTPDFSFEKTARFSHPRNTQSGVSYFVDPTTFPHHPTYSSLLRSNPSLFTSSHGENSREYKADLVAHLRREVESQGSGATAEAVKSKGGKLRIPNDWARFERKVEQSWVGRLQAYCRAELNQREDQLQRATGFMGIGTDHAAIARITSQRLVHCEELSKIPGYSVRY
ncbi:hypothetical protein JCM11641_004062 [Rhodosporidiobolus odoratus]